MKSAKTVYFLLGLLVLSACADPYPPTPHPDYAIRVIPTHTGKVAVPPPCNNWATDTTDPFDNQPLPQFGCATQRNLALMVDRPDDLLKGRELGPANGTTSVGSMLRYTNNQSRGLIWTGTDPNQTATTTAPSSSSIITGDVRSSGSSPSSGATP